MKILILDIETAPSLAYVWKLWDENIPLDRLISSGYLLCYAAKWHKKKEVIFKDKRDSDMHQSIHDLMSEADAIVHYNGNRFDIPILNKELLMQGMSPPSPAKQIDLFQVVKSKFKFTSNRLDHVTQELGLGGKSGHSGFKTWIGAMNDDEKAWNSMRKYNIQDIKITEKLYNRLLPWIEGHPNHNLYEGNGCPSCGKDTLIRRGLARTPTRLFQRWHCKSCGRWCRSSKSLPMSGVTVQPER